MAMQPAALDYNINSYLTYTSQAPIDIASLTAAVNPSVDVQPVGKVGELDDSHLLCIHNQPSVSGPSEQVLQVRQMTS